MKINYIIGTYLGQKRMMTMDGLGLTRKHLEQLTKFKNNIDKIYVVLPPVGQIEELRNVIKDFPSLNVEIMVRDDEFPNSGFCFGSWNYCLWKTADEADYTICVLDDYLPVIDNFDSILLKYFDSDKIAYVCQLHTVDIGNGQQYGGEWGGILGNGMLRNNVFKKCGGFEIAKQCIPTGESYHDAAITQSLFLKKIMDAGYLVKDVIKDYKGFMDRTKKITLYGDKDKPELFRPIECFIYNCLKYVYQKDGESYEYVTECDKE